MPIPINETSPSALVYTALDSTTGYACPLATDSSQRLLISSLPTGTNPLGYIIGQRTFSSTFSITRPANTTAYSIGQVLSTATSGLTGFPAFNLGFGGNVKFTIQSAAIYSSNGSAGTKGQFSLYLFTTASPSGGGFNDGAAFAVTGAAASAAYNAMIGNVASSLPNLGTAAYGYQLNNLNLIPQTDSLGNLYPAVVLNNAYTPASGEVIYITVSGVF